MASDPAPRRHPLLVTLALAVCAGGLVLPWAAPPRGEEVAGWMQFLGRFHPLVVHLPIAFLVLVPVLELAACRERWRTLREAAGFVLGLAALTAWAGVAAGYLLGWSGGYRGDLFEQHLWGGIALAVLVTLGWLARGAGAAPGRGYAVLLALALGTMAWTSHQGGSLTHGETYLTEHAPAPLKRLLGTPEPKARAVADAGAPVSAEPILAAHIQPIFDAHCTSCHNANKTKGGLRMDQFALLMKGGEGGPVIVPGDPAKSELIRRVTLPHDDDDFMPPDGKKPLNEQQIAVLTWWIRQGASDTLTLAQAKDVPASLVAKPKPKPVAVPDYAPVRPDIARVQQELGVAIVPVSLNPADGLALRTITVADRVDDAALAKLEKILPYVVDADLARTRITDKGLASLKGAKYLRKLRLDHTAVTAAGLPALAPLASLESLNLVGTKMGDAAVAQLQKFSAVKRLYIHETGLTSNAVTALRQKLPACEVVF